MRNSGWKEQKSDLAVADRGRRDGNNGSQWRAPTRTHAERPSRLQLPGSPDLPVPAATASAWKSWDLPLMLNHFLTRLLDHDSCKNGGLNAARRRRRAAAAARRRSGQVR